MLPHICIAVLAIALNEAFDVTKKLKDIVSDKSKNEWDFVDTQPPKITIEKWNALYRMSKDELIATSNSKDAIQAMDEDERYFFIARYNDMVSYEKYPEFSTAWKLTDIKVREACPSRNPNTSSLDTTQYLYKEYEADASESLLSKKGVVTRTIIRHDDKREERITRSVNGSEISVTYVDPTGKIEYQRRDFPFTGESFVDYSAIAAPMPDYAYDCTASWRKFMEQDKSLQEFKRQEEQRKIRIEQVKRQARKA